MFKLDYTLSNYPTWV